MIRPSRLPVSSPGPRRQRGVAAVYAGVTLVATFASMALVYDISQLYYAQRDLQRMASNAAADAARVASGCYSAAGVPASLAAATAEVTNSLSRNLLYSPGEGTGAGTQPTAAQLMQAYGSGGVLNGPSIPTVQFGAFKTLSVNGVMTRSFVPLAETDPRVDSVQVNLARVQPTPLIPILFNVGTGPAPTNLLRASASAQQSPVASYSLSTTLAAVSGPSVNLPGLPALPLCSLLGGTSANCITLSAVSPTGLANATITLNQLAAALNLGTAGHLLNTSLTTGTVLDGIATVLNGTGDAGQAAAASVLDTLAAFADPNRQVLPSQLVGVEDGVDAAIGDLPLNVTQLVTALAETAANGFYPVQLPISVPNLPGVTLTAFLSLGQTPISNSTPDFSRNGLGRSGFDQHGNPRTFANIQQLNLFLRLLIDSSQLPAVGAVLGPLAKINLGIDITGATATSHLDKALCPAPLSKKSAVEFDVAVESSAATVMVGTFANPTQPVIGGNLVAVGGGLVRVTIGGPVSTSLGSGSNTLMFTPPFPQTQTVGPTDATLNNALNALYGPLSSSISIGVGPLSIPVPGALLVAALKPTLTTLSTALDPIIQPLGISLGGATVVMNGFDYGTGSGLLAGNAAINSQPVVFNKTKPGLEAAVPDPSVLTGGTR